MQTVDDVSRELFSAIIDEIQIMKRESRILREAIENIRLQIKGLRGDTLALSSAIGFTSPQGMDKGIDGSGVERY